MRNNLLNDALLLEIVQGLAGQGAVDLQPVDEHGGRDEAVGLHVLLQLFGGVLVEDDGVVGFVLDCTAAICQLMSCGVGYGMACAVVIAYPCPWTTSSSASCRRLLLAPASTLDPGL